MKVLETARLVLRPFEWEDLEAFHRLAYADPDVAPWWTGRTKTIDQIRESFARKVEQVPGAPGWLAISLKATGALIGGMGLQRWQPDEDTDWFVPEDPEDAPKRDPQVVEVELAYVLGREFWGHGYATEAGRAVLNYGFDELNQSHDGNYMPRTCSIWITCGFHLGFGLGAGGLAPPARGLPGAEWGLGVAVVGEGSDERLQEVAESADDLWEVRRVLQRGAAEERAPLRLARLILGERIGQRQRRAGSSVPGRGCAQ